MNCPRDGSELVPQAFWKHPRQQCPKCRGTLIDEKDLLDAIGHEHLPALAKVLAASTGSGPSCPREGERMRILRHKGIELDVCPACRSLWLDDGEYRRIAAPSSASLEARWYGPDGVMDFVRSSLRHPAHRPDGTFRSAEEQRRWRFRYGPPPAPITSNERFALAVIYLLMVVPFVLTGPGILLAALLFAILYVGPTILLLQRSGLHGLPRWIFCYTAVPLFLVILVWITDWAFTSSPRIAQSYDEASASGGRRAGMSHAVIMVVPTILIMLAWYAVLRFIDQMLLRLWGKGDGDGSEPVVLSPPPGRPRR